MSGAIEGMDRSMAMKDYLQSRYCTAEVIAARSGMSLAEFDRLVGDGVIPQPSYIILPDRAVSAVFGDLPTDGAAPGRYFAPSQAAWIARALDTGAGGLEASFRDRMAEALAEADRSIFRLTDSFDEGGLRLPGLDARINDMWDSFVKGVFALCVVNGDCEAAIARKEILQEKLTALTAEGTSIDGMPEEELERLIDDYAAAAMPFAPSEYARTSRKRLVDDLRLKLAARKAGK